MSDQTELALGPPPIVAGEVIVKTTRVTDGVLLELMLDSGKTNASVTAARLTAAQAWNLGEALRQLSVARLPSET